MDCYNRGRSFPPSVACEVSRIRTIRNRAREHLPTVLLTLLSIVQALALELLWSQVRESAHLFALSPAASLAWLQLCTSFLGIIVIWIVYAGTAMRFRWIPTTGDSLYPFVVGLLEFALIETLAPEYMGWWFMLLGIIYGLMIWVTHSQMRRARLDGGNDEFFAHFSPATVKDFLPAYFIVGGAILFGIYLQMSGHRGAFAFIAVVVALVMLIRQLILTRRFWELSATDSSESNRVDPLDRNGT